MAYDFQLDRQYNIKVNSGSIFNGEYGENILKNSTVSCALYERAPLPELII